MIPIQLTIQGLYSYRKKQTIDFTRLTAAGLFGIFGGVGCGKSTILEAITFALYGESERLNSRENRNYNMMNLKSNELLIDYEFKTAGDEHYRFTVKGKRNGKNFLDVKAFDRSAYRFRNGDWEPMECSEVTSVIGLNYDNFRRTVIIPQGRFQEFLQLGTKERTQMLQELFNLNKYDLSGRVATLENQNNAQVQNITGQLQSIGTVSPGDLASREQQLIRMKEELVRQNKALGEIRKKVQDFELVRDNTQKLEIQNQHLAELQKREGQINQQEKEVVEYENFTRIFKSDFDQLHDVERRLKETITSLNHLEKEQVEAEKALALMLQSFELTRKAYDQKDQLMQESDELKKIGQIHLAVAETEKQKQLIDEANIRIKTKDESVATNKQLQNQLKEQMEQAKKDLPDWSLLSEIRKWFAEHRALLVNQKVSDDQLVRVAGQLREVKDHAVLRFQKAFPQEYAAAQQSVVDSESGQMALFAAQPSAPEYSEEQMNTLIVQKKAELTKQQEQTRTALTKLQVKNELHRYATELSDGDPCPLCGAVHHPGIQADEDISGELKKTGEQLQNIQQKTDRLNQFEQNFIQTRTQVNAWEEQLKSGKEKAAADRKAIEAHNALFDREKWPYADEQSVNEAFKRAEQINEALRQQTTRADELQKQIEKEEKEREEVIRQKDLLDKKQVETETRMTLLSAQIKKLRTEDYAQWTTGMTDEKVRQLEEQYKVLVARYRKEEEELTAMRTKSGTLKGSIEIHRKNIEAQQKRQQQLNEMIDENLRQHRIESAEQVQRTLSRELDTVRCRREIETFRRDKEVTVQAIRQLTEQLAGRAYQPDEHQKAIKEEQELSGSVTELNRQSGRIEQELQQMKERLKKSEELNAVLAKLTLRGDDIRTLKTLFRSNAFVNYVSTVYLSNLCKAANERFYKLTRQKLSLELTDDNNFQVCDFMNEGKVRSVKTLSGGQTFQASLSLALSLADSIHRVSSEYENFFFLDEGFGTLDKDSLDVVFETLKALRKENRIVGVISHVEEMQQEIETYLRVTNKEAEGSIITSSWEE